MSATVPDQKHILTEDLPLESAKRSRGLRCATDVSEAYSVAHEHGQRDETGKPEDHRQTLNARDDACVVQLGLSVPHWHEDQVGEGD